MATPNDEYAIWRTAPDAVRLCYQHFLWRELYKANIHPSIDLSPDKPDLRIAEFATGHGLWAIQVAEEFPNAQVEASDVNLGLLPAKPDLPSNLSVRHWSFFDPIPEEWRSAFDLIHVRLLMQVFGGNQDPRPVLEKFVQMLKPGGILQWDEYDYSSATQNNVYTTTSPTLIPHPEITHPSSTELWQLIFDTFKWPTAHFAQMSTYFTSAGLVDVANHRIRPPKGVFRAFYEHWYALNCQLVSVMEEKDERAGKRARELVGRMKGDAEEGVFSAHLVKIVVGKRPGAAEGVEL